MPEFPPEDHDVVAIVSRQEDEQRRAFSFDGEPPAGADALPDLEELSHEKDLLEAMKEAGYRLTMIGGGAGPEELRRFYFRPIEET